MLLHLPITVLVTTCVTGVFGIGLAQEGSPNQLVTLFGEIRKKVDQEVEGSRSSVLAELAEVQARAGLQEDAEKTFTDFVVSLQGRSLGRDTASIQISLLSRMAIAADKAGDHAAAIQYLNRAFDLTKGRTFQRTQTIDSPLILNWEAEFDGVMETAFELREQILADKVFVTGNEIIVGLPGDETDKVYAQGTLHLTRIAAQLKLGQKIAARASIQSFAVKFADYEDAWPCHHSSRLAPLLAELGDFEKAIEVMDRCFARRNKILKNHPEDDPSHGDTARYRFYKARDLASVARAVWRGGYQSQATQLFENALTLGRTTPFDDQFFWETTCRGSGGDGADQCD